jgi:GNAT superfamily N-acetyltransferase
MFSIKYATEEYRSYRKTRDRHISDAELTLKIRDKRCYILKENDKPIGVMRYNLFWDIIPFLILIYFEESFRSKGYGMKAMLHWENEMRQLGHKIAMTSTMVEESSQHFYRKLGYKDCGCLIKDITPYVETMEMFMMKQLV